MTVRDRDPWDDLVTTDERWVSIVFKGENSRTNHVPDRKTMSDAEDWAKSEFGNGFFRLGYKFFFNDREKLVMFQMRWI